MGQIAFYLVGNINEATTKAINLETGSNLKKWPRVRVDPYLCVCRLGLKFLTRIIIWVGLRLHISACQPANPQHVNPPIRYD